MLTLQEISRSRYLLHRGLRDAGFPATRACLAVDVLLGPELDQADDDDAPESGWDDSSTWELGPGEPEAPTFEPNPDDEEWLGRQLSDAEIDAVALACAWQDMTE